MNTLVVDASVAAKWFLPASGETLTDEALEVLSHYAAGDLRFLVPDLFWAELGNIFRKAARQGRWSQAPRGNRSPRRARSQPSRHVRHSAA